MSKYVQLGNIAKIYSGGTPSRTNPDYWRGRIPWIKTAQIQNCVITESDVDEWITEEGLKKSSAKMVPKGTILMAMYGQGKTRGQVAILGLEASINQACAAIELDEQSDRMFVFQQLLYRYESIRALSNTGSQENLTAGLIKEIEFPLPSLLEQTAIANLLSTWDEAIEKTDRLISAKEMRFTSLTQELIHNCAEGLSHFHIRDICEPVTRKNTVNELNVLTTSAQHGLISQMDYYKKSVSAEDVRGYYLLKKGEFAYNRSSSNGYPYGAIKRLENYPQGVLSTLYLCFSLKKDAPCDSDFMAHAFEAGLLNKQLVGVCQEGARSHGLLNITKTDFFGLKLSLPQITEQRKIAAILSTARQEIDLLKKQVDALRRQKRGLMQKLLTGIWRVKIGVEVAQ